MSGLYVAKLSLRHFRSHQRADLAFDGRPVVIHGANGSGKTNLIEAISLLSPGRGLRRAATDDLIRRPESLGWKVTAQIGGHDLETQAEPGGSRQVRIDGKAKPQIALGKIARILWLIPAMDRLWIEGADGRRRFLDRAALSFDPSHAEAVLEYEKAMRERNRLLKDMVRDPHWYGVLERRMATAGIRIHKGRQATVSALLEAQRNAATVFPVADLEIVQVDRELPETEDALTEAFADGRQTDMSAGRTLLGPHRSDLRAIWKAKNVLAKDCSTGEQKALLISLILANARALKQQQGNPPVLLLDEVAAHLDADRRAALYDEICGLGTQAFMTGTGPELFSDLGSRMQSFEVLDTDGVSEVRLDP